MKKSALLVIDVQNEMFQVNDPVYEGDRLLHNLKQLIAKARSGGIPVIYIQHNDEGLMAGSEVWKINSEITPAMYVGYRHSEDKTGFLLPYDA